MVDRQREREDKYDVDAGWRLPDLADLLPERGRLETAELRLVNTYFDTPSAHLAQLGVTLRRREGGPDAGWHLKVPAGLARTEITDSSDSSTLPQELGSILTGLRAGEELRPTATLTVVRTTHRLTTDDGAVMAEVADDLVSAATMGEESRLSSWREVEVELKPAGNERLLKVIGRRLRAAGAERSASRSKISRALGSEEAPSRPRHGTLGALVVDYLGEQVHELVRCDLAVRLGEPEVHKFRVALRRMRSTLRVFGPVFDEDRVARLEPELVWLAGLLGEVRDRDVLAERLAAQVAALPEEMVLGPVAAHIKTTLLLERKERLDELTAAMDGERYAALVREIIAWQAAPPLTERAGKAAPAAAAYVKRAERKVRKRLAQADGEVEALHDARKAAKRYRYAAELAEPILGRAASRTVKSTTELQTQLGEHQDSVVSAAFLRRLGAEAGVGEGQNGFTYGLLLAMEWQRADEVSRRAGRRWGKKH